MQTKLLNLKNQALALISQADSKKELERLRIQYLGRKGQINQILKEIPQLDKDQKAQLGRLTNDVKTAITQTLKTKLKHLSQAKPRKEFFDPTLPSQPAPVGQLHPITQIINQVEDIFSRFGFTTASGPEIEWDKINFQKLLLGPDHPSRDTQETYYFDDQQLLRVHTSSVQIRYMQKNQPPIRIIVPGRVYRRDTIDATHLPSFYQIEGLMVDNKTTLTDLLGILEHTAKSLFGQDRKVRFYGHHFPYTEPSLEVEIQNDKGQWLEILGCGMVHPQVLINCKIDPKKYQGWAFGMGADRLAMLKFGITDIRNLYSGDLRFLNYAGS